MSAAIRWECQVGHIDDEGDLVIFDVTIETRDIREAIRQCSQDFPSDDIEWVKVRRA